MSSNWALPGHVRGGARKSARWGFRGILCGCRRADRRWKLHGQSQMGEYCRSSAVAGQVGYQRLTCLRENKKTAPAPEFGVKPRHLALNAVGPCGSVISIDCFPATIEPITLAHTSAIGHTSARVAGKRSVWNQSRRCKRRRHLGEHLVQGQVRIGARRACPTIVVASE